MQGVSCVDGDSVLKSPEILLIGSVSSEELDQEIRYVEETHPHTGCDYLISHKQRSFVEGRAAQDSRILTYPSADGFNFGKLATLLKLWRRKYLYCVLHFDRHSYSRFLTFLVLSLTTRTSWFIVLKDTAVKRVVSRGEFVRMLAKSASEEFLHRIEERLDLSEVYYHAKVIPYLLVEGIIRAARLGDIKAGKPSLRDGRLGPFVSRLNAHLNRKELKLNKQRLYTYPQVIQFGVTNKCNIRCWFCGTRFIRGKDRKELPIELYRKVAKDFFPFANQIKFNQDGEFFLHPHFEEMLLTASRFPAETEVCTNGMLLDDEIARFLVEKKIHLLTISMDGATPKTVESIRSGLDFNRVMANIQNINRWKLHHHSGLPVLSFHCAAMKRNLDELVLLIELAHKMEVDLVNIAHVVIYDWMDEYESPFYHKELCNRVMEEARRRAEELEITLVCPKPFSLQKEDCQNDGNVGESCSSGVAICKIPWDHVILRPNGDVVPCCMMWEGEEVMGNLFEAGLREIWNNERYRHLRKTVNRSPELAKCIACNSEKEEIEKRNSHIKNVANEETSSC
jgi:radical SAM protein with 4Fe4S-binding SPASM domain